MTATIESLNSPGSIIELIPQLPDELTILRKNLSSGDDLDLNELTTSIQNFPRLAMRVVSTAISLVQHAQPDLEVRSLRHAIALIGTVRLTDILETFESENSALRKTA